MEALRGGDEHFATMNLTSGSEPTLPKGVTARGRTLHRMGTRDNIGVKDIEGASPFIRILTIKDKPFFHDPSVSNPVPGPTPSGGMLWRQAVV